MRLPHFPFSLNDSFDLATMLAVIAPNSGADMLSSNAIPTLVGDAILQENGDYILQENGDYILQEVA